MSRALAVSLAVSFSLALGCQRPPKPARSPAGLTIGLVTDVGGRGDQAFNDAALRGLEAWSCGLAYTAGGYRPLTASELQATVPEDLPGRAAIRPIAGTRPIVLEGRGQGDYRPDLALLADKQVDLAVGVGFLLADAVAAEARLHPTQRYLLVDSPLLDAAGKPTTAPNVASVTFRDQEGCFLAGVLAGLASHARVGFVGGMQVPIVRRYEVAFRAGVMAVDPVAAKRLLVEYTGSFDDSSAGKRVGQYLYASGADVVFAAAGADGLGVISAAEQAGRWVIGNDSDQSFLAPRTVLTSMVKHVDYAIYASVQALADGAFTAGTRELGLAEGGVGLAPVRIDFPGRAQALARVDAYRRAILAGRLRVPTTEAELAAFTPAGP